ncbi:MAG: DUF6498-containing protein [Bacteroidota bacterium]
MLKRIFLDPIIYFLLGINVALLLAYYQGVISVETIIYTYYFQSLAIGLSYYIQMLTLTDYSVEGFKINGVQAEKSPKTKGCTTTFFLFHFGFFHLGYLIFLLVSFKFNVDSTFLWSSVIAFAIGECIAVFRRRVENTDEKPNIGTLMFTPYLRIIPMHIFILAGGFLGHTEKTFIIFILLKIISDILMHIVVNKTYKAKATGTEQPPIIQL